MEELSGSGDPDVDAFFDAHISSFAAWDVVVYLARNIDAGSDVGCLARRLGRKEREIEPVLRDLAGHGVVQASTEGDGVTRYSLSPDPKARWVVARFVELTSVRGTRLEFVRRVLAGMPRV